MAQDSIPHNEDKLYKIAQRISLIPREHAQLIREEKEKLIAEIQSYFAERMERSHGIVTDDMLEVADKLYIPGMSILLADTLDMSPGELRKKLGRKIQVKCEDCGGVFEIIEQRTVHGYSQNSEKLCSDCRKQRSLEYRDADEQARWELEQDIKLASKVAISKNPLEIDAFRRKLRHFAQHWVLDGYEQMTWSYAFSERCGCMLCGKTPFRLYIDLITPMDERKQQIWQGMAAASYMENPFPPIVRSAQALVQFKPGTYYMCYPHFPVSGMPVVLLCSECAKVISKTHVDALDEDFGG